MTPSRAAFSHVLVGFQTGEAYIRISSAYDLNANHGITASHCWNTLDNAPATLDAEETTPALCWLKPPSTNLVTPRSRIELVQSASLYGIHVLRIMWSIMENDRLFN